MFRASGFSFRVSGCACSDSEVVILRVFDCDCCGAWDSFRPWSAPHEFRFRFV